MAYSPIDSRSLARQTGSWLGTEGPDADVVISCRVRLARNVEGVPFMTRIEADRAEQLSHDLRLALLDARIDGETRWVPMTDASPVLRLLLLERNLISRDLLPRDAQSTAPGRAVAFGETETVSVMVNEEDHVRLQALAAGFDLDLAWQRAEILDRYLEDRVTFATSSRLGYLTGCPTNVGTGLRASVMLHLPALGMVRSELEKVFSAAQRTGLAVRGMHGEGSRAAGDLYQISNQVTLGRCERDLIDDLRALVPEIVRFERRMRATLVDEMSSALHDRITQSFGTLRTSRAIPTDAALAHLSYVRLGLHTGLFEGTRIEVLNELGLQVQRGHIQVLQAPGEEDDLLDASERDKLRASYLRKRLAGYGPRGNGNGN
ncbi:MAG: ATP--guanido phosphotransferase [Planctomycetota bacterium]